MNGIKSSPMPNIATSRDKVFARLPVDAGSTALREGREFRFVKKITSPLIYRFTSPIDFVLTLQSFAIVSGEYQFHAWRSDNVTPSGVWTQSTFFAKNTSQVRELYDGVFYEPQAMIETGGSIVVADASLYSDFQWMKSAGGVGNSTSISDVNGEARYLAAGSYYLQFTGVGEGSYRIAWEEMPSN